MPLPDKDMAWPPIHPAIRCAMEDWSAWFSANPDRLAYRYQNRPRTDGSRFGAPQNRPSQYRGGFVGTIARFFWGEPTPLGEKRANLHMPLAKDIARTSSDLLFSEPPTLKAENKATQERLEALMDIGMKRTLIASGETGAALGGSYLRIVWDEDVADRPWISLVHADGAAPEFAHGDKLKAVTFWTVLAVDGQKVVRHLERHEPGTILHGVYEGSEDNLGKPIDLAAFEQTKNLLPARTLPIGKRLAVSYIPNSMIAPDWRDIPGAAGLGASDYQGAETFLSAIDETYTSWMRDVRLAKSRIIVPSGYLQSNGPGAGALWEDREAFAAMNIPPTADQAITLNQFAIRHEEHRSTVDELVGKVIRNAGYSGGTFGDDSGGPAVTATEIKARQARSMSTRARKAELYEVGIADAVEVLLMLEASGMFKGVPRVEVERPDVVFQDSVQDDIKTLAETAELLRRAEAASTETLVALTRPDLDEVDQREEVDRILKETGRLVADPVMTGAEGEGVPNAGFPSDGGGSGERGSPPV
ncbi:phage portal protein [Streptomyces europaeiscabiei]|uniref:phage portal protein n=1 Tax=Streptomyces europaeiscabiei TaxID=146819 RepID=UPI0029AC73C5|nr:phage portal protein [Streptomyces europaeiscabiei]MDX3582529.1 phage portal protein [Streptomyces europaeiscabiei]